MEIVTRYALDSCQIVESTKCILVRSRVEKWVVSGAEEMLVDNNSHFHRITLSPGNWSGADQWGVRKYADVVWTQEAIDAWRQHILALAPHGTLPVVSGSLESISGSQDQSV